MKQRILSQDIAKGLAILLVIFMHCTQVTRPVASVFGVTLGFAMPFFMFMAGYNYKKIGLSPWQNTKKRLKSIIIPFFKYSLLIFVVMGAYYYIRGEATIPEICKSFFAFLISKWGAQLLGWQLPQVMFQRLLGPLWFIQFLITASVVFYLTVDWATSNIKRFYSTIVLLSSITVLAISYGVILPWGIQNAPAIACVMIIAVWFKQENILYETPSKKYWTYINCFVCIAINAIIQLNYNTAGYIAAGSLGKVMGGAEVYVMFVVAIIGTYFLINISKAIEKVPVLSTVLVWFGQHTLLLLFLQMTVIHVVKDILGLPQINAAEKLIVEDPDPMNLVALALSLIILYFLVTLIEKTEKAVANKKKISKA